ncbi:MAG: prepilin peptidase [Candidatus Nanopelagicales bacterium]|nr:prepilin peptidase [Candidatus Nanopelagicales bacterium]MCF8538060.1 prepilin peptidase [Candidatus Nanopelagicales bacterium]MCF8542704.1 prepilin peptidase [Candidatus Nanopelagicales bacterium]MCF8556689.1 prepilin peptidase [Candidatus Nanopelagicales bacterium]
MSDVLPVIVVLIGLLGVIIGSFLNVVIHRVPEGQSLVRPGSACPACGAAVRPRDNIPIVSWLLLRGRCRDCSAPISKRYPIVEAVTGVLWAVLAWWALVTPDALPLLPLVLVLTAAGVALTVIDLDHHRLPNAIVLTLYPVTVAGLLLAGALGGRWPWAAAGIGAALWLVVIGIPWLVSGGRGMGFGDVKLAPVLGVTLGWWALSASVVGLFLAFGLGALVGIILMIAGRAGRKTALPFGPFLLVGALVGLLVGPAIGSAYGSWLSG